MTGTHSAELLRRSSTILFHSGVDEDDTQSAGTSSPVIAILGLGEAGGRIAGDLVSAGAEVRGYDPVVAAAPAGVSVAGDPARVVSGCTVVLALTTAASAVAAAESALPGLSPGALYADLNTASPALKREVAALVADAGGVFADVALLGPIPTRGLRAPALASGPGARAFADLLGPLGMPVEVVSNRVGDAAVMKLVRSVFMKGLAACTIESLRAAEAAGHGAWLEGEIAGILGGPLLERLVEGSRAHAARRVEEMEAAAALLSELGVEPRVATASASLLGELAAGGS
jgi:NAD binding domain of 6-phosphogluconate dehydrogenase/Domain of unknown function (DUF1932)